MKRYQGQRLGIYNPKGGSIGMVENANAVKDFVALVERRTRQGASLELAVRSVRTWHVNLCSEALEIIGHWPSSEPELAELQRQAKG